MELHYRLACPSCGKIHDDAEDRFPLSCTEPHPPALLRALFDSPRFDVQPDLPGIFRYRCWLPVRRTLPEEARPAVFPAGPLAERLGLKRLFLAVSGYWPEKGAYMETCSFKELEAVTILARLLPRPLAGLLPRPLAGLLPRPLARLLPRPLAGLLPRPLARLLPCRFPRAAGTLVVASAGNTGRAFLQYSCRTGVPVLVVVPEAALPGVWTTVARQPAASLLAVKAPSDYADAIETADRIAKLPGFFPEGGARNVARRDGLGTVLLSAVEATGEIPRHYFQAVGSGTGAIGVWEANLRLIGDGRFGGRKTRLHLSQNEPFTILSDAWERRSRSLGELPEGEAKARIARLHSPVLSNRKPPYGLCGGLYDALEDTDGAMYRVATAEALDAGRLFRDLEGCDLDPAAEVALASLMQAVRSGAVKPEESVLLNLTGAGGKRVEREGRARPFEPDRLIAKGGDVERLFG